MDFVSDSLASGRRIKCLTVPDDFSHECVDIAVDHGISGCGTFTVGVFSSTSTTATPP
jgi:hypothetical protein